METFISDGGGPIQLQYIDLNGVVGVFVKLDSNQLDESELERLELAVGHQLRMFIQANREGAPLQKARMSISYDIVS